MYLYFEDWSAFISDLRRKNIPHGGKIIKVFASEGDPRESFDNPRLKVVEVVARSLDSKVFRYQNTREFPGRDIEEFMGDIGLNDSAKQIIRSLIIFADDTEIWQGDMGIRVSCRRLINHPLDKIDGIRGAVTYPERRTPIIHMDVFTAPALQRLKTILDHDNGQLLVPAKEGALFKMSASSSTKSH